MATRTRRRRSASRRVRRNPPKMTPAMRRKIGNRIRALHRSGKYRRSSPRRAAVAVRRASRRVSKSIGRTIRRSTRRSSGSMMKMSGGAMGLKAILSKDNMLMAGGALGATFLANYGAALIMPRLPASVSGNIFVQSAIKLGIAGITAKVASKYSRPLAQGVMIGGLLVVANDLIRMYATPTGTTSQYLGGRRAPLGQYLGGPRPGAAIGPVSPAQKTFSMKPFGGVYGGGSAFKSDAWARG